MSSSASKKRKFQKDNRESASRDSVVTTSADTDSNFKSKTKISIGQEIWRWCKLKSDRNLKSHCEVAKLLLDIYEVHTKKRIFPDLSEDDSDSSSVEDGSDDAQPPTATISKTPSEEASSSTGHNQIVQVKIETVDIHQEADPHIITELATARTSHIPLIVKTEYADPEQTFSEHGKIQVPGIPEACFPNKEEPPSEQDIKLQVPSNQTYALAPESFDSAIHIEHAVEEESENEAEVHDTQKMEVNAAMETAKNQSKSRSSRVKSRTSRGLESSTFIEQAIKEVINTGREKLDALSRVLEELGVETEEDLAFVKEEDLFPHASRIEARQLVKAWTKTADRTTSQEKVPVQHTLVTPKAPSVSTELATALRQAGNFSANWATNFKILLSQPLKKELLSGKHASKKTLKNVVRSIMEQVFEITRKPRKKDLAVIAKKTVDAYPDALEDRYHGKRLGTGYETLLSKLVFKRDNETRQPHKVTMVTKQPKLKRVQDEENDEPAYESSQDDQTTVRDSYGCVNWTVDLEQCIEGSEEYIFGEQRRAIVYGADVENLMEMWPDFFILPNFLAHANKVLGMDIQNKMMESLKGKSNHILNFMKTQAVANEVFIIMEQVLEELEDSNPALPAVPWCLVTYFKEDITLLFREVEKTASPNDVCQMVLPSTPCLVVCGKLLKAGHFMLVVDGIVVIPKIDDFTVALTAVCASYFVFGIRYPVNLAATLEFFQRCFLNIDPVSGSKMARSRRKKKFTTNPKLLALIQQLGECEWTS